MNSIRKRIWAFSVLVIVFFVISACNKKERFFFNIREGTAAYTLKEYAKQANVEIIFNAPDTVDVRTIGISGKMTPEEALSSMLSGTSLVFKRDVETGAYAVTEIFVQSPEKY